MAVFWIPLREGWKLQDVQAGLNVVVAVLSFLAAFTYVQYCWQRTAKQVSKGRAVPLHALLSVGTLGEALDVISLLRRKILSRRYLNICLQCLVVTVLAIVTILSGVIARYSVRQGDIMATRKVPGLLAWHTSGGLSFANLDWNTTYEKLDRANFPVDQLLDFVPDASQDWIYDPVQWNNSWSFECAHTPRTLLPPLQATGNCTDLLFEIPGIEQAFSYEQWDYYYSANSLVSSDGKIADNDLLITYGSRMWDYNETEDTMYSMSLLLAFTYMEDVPTNYINVTSGCTFGVGDIPVASYVKIECELRRRSNVPDYHYVAGPDTPPSNLHLLPQAYQSYYFSNFKQQASTRTLTYIAPEQIARFYQAYVAVADVVFPKPVSRQMSVRVSVVQLSTVFLTIALLVAILILLGLASHCMLVTRHGEVVSSTPQSKLDWMLQSIEAEDRPPSDPRGGLRKSVTVDSIAHFKFMPYSKRRRGEFETARYGGRGTETRFMGGVTTPADSDSIPIMSHDIYHLKSAGDYSTGPVMHYNTHFTTSYPIHTARDVATPAAGQFSSQDAGYARLR